MFYPCMPPLQKKSYLTSWTKSMIVEQMRGKMLTEFFPLAETTMLTHAYTYRFSLKHRYYIDIGEHTSHDEELGVETNEIILKSTHTQNVTVDRDATAQFRH